MSELRNLLGKQLLFLDGGSGSLLQSWGLKAGELPETWNVLNPERIIQLGYDYYSAGSNVIYTNTFGAYSPKFEDTAISHSKETPATLTRRLATGANVDLSLKNIVQSAVACANEARKRWREDCKKNNKDCQKCFVALDIGPCGKLLKPMGDLDFEDAVNLFKTTIRYGLEKDVDAIVIETMNDAYETKAAVLAAKEVCEELNKDVPLLVTNVYDLTCHLLTGAEPEAMVAILEGLGVDALGINCSLGPKEMLEPIRRLIASSSIPVIVKPNAGLPRDVNGTTVFDVEPKDFAETMVQIAKMGACVLGGCCGTTPEHIRLLIEQIKEQNPILSLFKQVEYKNTTIVSSYTHTVQIGGGNVPVLIGERINPTGKKKFKEALRNKDIPYIIKQGLEQESAGAHILDVNVGLPEIDEKEMMVKVMTELQGVTNIPLQLDTSSPEVMEAALRRYNGKALVNSVNGKQVVMDAIFPLVKKYGGVVVGLTIDEEGIPETTEGRVKVAEKIYKNADKWGIPRKNIIIDSLTMSISSDINAAKATLETIKIIREQFGGSSVLGVSNISFGLPNRPFVTSAFFTLAMQNGLGAAIMNPLESEMMKAWHCYVLLSGNDKDCLRYLDFSQKYDQKKEKEKQDIALTGVQGAVNAIYGAFPSSGQVNPALTLAVKVATADSIHQKQEQQVSTEEVLPGTLKHAVIHGLKDDSAKLSKQLLDSGITAVEVIDSYLIPGLDYVGKRFEQKKMYLPQLLMAADAAKSAFSVIKEFLEKTGQKGEPKGTCIVATVHGDIHDIGKNIVKVLLENYDFNVIDLGKDVPPEVVVEACKKDHVQLVGLSALMTTTVPAMKETIIQLRKECPWAKCCVGGAVMTQEYADSIGADFYGKDAMDTVKYAQRVFG